MRIPSYSVVFHEEILEWLISRLAASTPNECAVFLAGSLRPTKESFYISAYYEPNQVGEYKSVDWDDKELLDATAWAARKETTILGWAHSHIYDCENAHATQLSRRDASTQIKYNLPLSMILAFWPGTELKTGHDFYLDVWKLGYAASLDVFVEEKKRTRTFDSWVRRYSK